MNIRTACLALLAHGEASGYDLKKRWTEGPFSRFFDASFGSIYPTLAKLEQEGLVLFRQEGQAGKPLRKVYSLTESGRQAFMEALSAPPEPDVFRSAFALLALCAPFLPAQVLERAIEVRLNDQRAELAELEAIASTDTRAPISWLVAWGIHHFRSDIAFLEAKGAELAAMAGSAEPGGTYEVCPSCTSGADA
ncbi:PadR family transcriptional regulator [Terrihabitans rhizophilus]|uniref:PadR family transcriptional regulator n=1 Tax=Terrihabitans rhizophilus TaxID=3092662 RepID=A0ABU4RP52_9HYPH|nr:PadR family transcriptional regulator [Terrihabitans sp. PJ23]MDX6806637.1 PadR family transcriptional regulator [Terrihabitans sp. PJ23]